MIKESHTQNLFKKLVCFVIIFASLCISLFCFAGCNTDSNNQNTSQPPSSQTRRVKLTTSNVNYYISFHYSVNKTPYNSNTTTKYVNHEYTVWTSRTGVNYTFENVVIGISYSKSVSRGELRTLSINGSATFNFKRTGPIFEFQEPNEPVIVSVQSGYVVIS